MNVHIRPLVNISLAVALGLLVALLAGHSTYKYTPAYTPAQLYNTVCLDNAASGCNLAR